jgi:signal transduction histidine kinase
VTGAARDLAPGLDLTAYRLIQEGLTNALRHARYHDGARVSIDYGDDRIELAVRDDGAPTNGSAVGDAPADGNGLLGMRERVAVYGGSLVARQQPKGGFELVATLPLEPA